MKMLILFIMLIAGCLFGLVLKYIINYLINKRGFHTLKHNKLKAYFIIIFNGLGWLSTVAILGLNIRSIQVILVISICLVLSIIDIEIRKIPNEIILLLFIMTVSFFLIGGSLNTALSHFIGFMVGMLIFIMPFLFKTIAGGGDIKYAAAMGFCLGYPNILRAILIMSGALFIWLIYLLLTKKGGLKTQLAMGAFMSIGFVTTLIISNIK